MKKFILLSLVLASQMASASEVLSKKESRKVIQAIIESLPSTDLTCSSGETLGSSSKLDLSLYLEKYRDTKPARVILVKTEGNEGMIIQLGNDKNEITTSIDTDSSFKVIKGIIIEQVEYSKKTVNVGSLIEPRYGEVVSRNVTTTIKCE